MQERAIERELRNTRFRFINIVKAESAQNIQGCNTRDRKKCVEQLLADEDQSRRQDCPFQLSAMEAHFREHHPAQSIDLTSQAARKFLEPSSAVPERVHRIERCSNENFGCSAAKEQP